MPVLDAADLGLVAGVEGHAYYGGPVAEAPGYVDGRLVVGHEPLVAVDYGGDDHAHTPGVAEYARHVLERHLAQTCLAVPVTEEIPAVLQVEHALVVVAAAPVHPPEGLRHEGRGDALLLSDRLDDELVEDDVIRRL